MKNVLPRGYPAGKNVGVVGLDDPCEHMHNIFKDLLQGANVTDFTFELEKMRMVKEAGEKEIIGKALDLAGRCIEKMRVSVADGSTPLQIIADVELEAALGGAELMDKRNVFVNLWDGESGVPPSPVDRDAILKGNERLFTEIYLQFEGYWVHRAVLISENGTGSADDGAVEKVGYAVSDVLTSMSVGDDCPSIASAVDTALTGHGLEPCYPQTKAGIRGHGIGLDIRDPPQFGPSSPHKVYDGMIADLDIEVKLPGGKYHYTNFVFQVEGGKAKLINVPALKK
jgi:Xaa-Pro aminopeptidase